MFGEKKPQHGERKERSEKGKEERRKKMSARRVSQSHLDGVVKASDTTLSAFGGPKRQKKRFGSRKRILEEKMTWGVFPN